jgi:hypothetical protein
MAPLHARRTLRPHPHLVVLEMPGLNFKSFFQMNLCK